MTIEIVVDGVQYSNFESASMSSSMDSLASEFTFDAVSTESLALPFKGGESCQVLVAGNLALTGNIEIVNGSYGARSHTITIQGRSKTGDIVDSTLEEIELVPPIQLKAILEKVLDQLGLDVNVVLQPETLSAELSGSGFNKAEDLIGPKIGENAFSFIDRVARKSQVLLGTDPAGNLAITRNDPTLIDTPILNKINGTENNVLSGSFNYDHTGRYSAYVVRSQQNATAAINAGAIDLSSVVSQSGSAIDSDVRPGRRLVIKAEKASSNEQAQNRATWEGNIRRTRSTTYTVTVQGHENSSGIWALNKLVDVDDDFADISSRMLIDQITFNFDRSGGSTTTLRLVDKDSYKVELAEPTPTDNVGMNFFG